LGKQFEGAPDDRGQIHGFAGQAVFAAEFPHVVDDARGPGDVAAYALGHFGEAGLVRELAASKFAAQVVGDGLDDRHGLVELMGHAGRHLAEGRHFACLDELLFGFEPARDVRDRGQVDPAARIFGRGHPDGGVEGLAVFAAVAHRSMGRSARMAASKGVVSGSSNRDRKLWPSSSPGS
jgi:hypothetical protein